MRLARSKKTSELVAVKVSAASSTRFEACLGVYTASILPVLLLCTSIMVAGPGLQPAAGLGALPQPPSAAGQPRACMTDSQIVPGFPRRQQLADRPAFCLAGPFEVTTWTGELSHTLLVA